MVPRNETPDGNFDNRTLEEIYELAQVCREFLSRKNGNTAFEELTALAERVGFRKRSHEGSHVVYKHPTHTMGPVFYDTLNFQKVKGKAKPYQMKQLVDFIRQAWLKPRSK